MNSGQRQEILDDEYLIVRNSGEIPEITLHSAVHYLTEDADGPGLTLSGSELDVLKSAAGKRFHEIILRDIQLANYHKTLYRGIRRSIYNLQRYQQFCKRQEMDWKVVQQTAGGQVRSFLDEGVVAAGKELPKLFLNCSFQQLLEFVEECGVAEEELPDTIEQFCEPTAE